MPTHIMPVMASLRHSPGVRMVGWKVLESFENFGSLTIDAREFDFFLSFPLPAFFLFFIHFHFFFIFLTFIF